MLQNLWESVVLQEADAQAKTVDRLVEAANRAATGIQVLSEKAAMSDKDVQQAVKMLSAVKNSLDMVKNLPEGPEKQQHIGRVTSNLDKVKSFANKLVSNAVSMENEELDSFDIDAYFNNAGDDEYFDPTVPSEKELSKYSLQDKRNRAAERAAMRDIDNEFSMDFDDDFEDDIEPPVVARDANYDEFADDDFDPDEENEENDAMTLHSAEVQAWVKRGATVKNAVMKVGGQHNLSRPEMIALYKRVEEELRDAHLVSQAPDADPHADSEWASPKENEELHTQRGIENDSFENEEACAMRRRANKAKNRRGEENEESRIFRMDDKEDTLAPEWQQRKAAATEDKFGTGYAKPDADHLAYQGSEDDFDGDFDNDPEIDHNYFDEFDGDDIMMRGDRSYDHEVAGGSFSGTEYGEDGDEVAAGPWQDVTDPNDYDSYHDEDEEGVYVDKHTKRRNEFRKTKDGHREMRQIIGGKPTKWRRTTKDWAATLQKDSVKESFTGFLKRNIV